MTSPQLQARPLLTLFRLVDLSRLSLSNSGTTTASGAHCNRALKNLLARLPGVARLPRHLARRSCVTSRRMGTGGGGDAWIDVREAGDWGLWRGAEVDGLLAG